MFDETQQFSAAVPAIHGADVCLATMATFDFDHLDEELAGPRWQLDDEALDNVYLMPA